MTSILTQPEEKRLARLQEYADQIEDAMIRMNKSISEGDMTGFSEEEVRFYLSTTPTLIAQSGLLLAKMTRDYNYAKLDTKIIAAELWKKCNQLKDNLGLSSAKDREAYVQTQPEYIKAQQAEVEWKYRLDQMQIIYERYDALWVSCRKIANLIENDTQNQYRREKYE